MSEVEQLAALCVRLGASQPQAETMAAQLLKRADQLAAEHRVPRTETLRYLVEVVVRGRSGEPPSTPPWSAPRAE